MITLCVWFAHQSCGFLFLVQELTIIKQVNTLWGKKQDAERQTVGHEHHSYDGGTKMRCNISEFSRPTLMCHLQNTVRR